MPHKTRSARKANAHRRAEAAFRQRPMSAEAQAETAAHNRAAHQTRYPDPPVYRYSHDQPEPMQPSCYWGWREWAALRRKLRAA